MKLIRHIFILFLVFVTNLGQSQATLEDKLISQFNEGVHIVAEVSNSTTKLDELITVTYKLYVSPNIGISNYEVIEDSKSVDYKVDNVLLPRIKVKYEQFKNEQYRLLVFKKSILKSKRKGAYNFTGLKLNVTAEIPSKETDQFGRPLMKKVNRTIKANDFAITVI
ncbi:hypothetical protein [Winogradskyella sp. PE311]|uniref:hypothetical protein n=1 Tax=Winogradskyella sp. PE311 TaxID=3366943 RepID=UPI00397EF2FD